MMNDFRINEERLKYKTELVLRVNYFSSITMILFGFICYYVLEITEIIPFVSLTYGFLNLINVSSFKKHRRVELAYNISSILALISALIITLYSGGIKSSFIFTMALIVLAGYISRRNYGRFYLYFILFLVFFIYSQSIPQYAFTYNVVPDSAKNLFSLFSVLFTIYLLGNIFGRTLLRTYNIMYRSKKELLRQMEEKEILLKEVHHRVKNNLQTVSSLLSLQSRSIRGKNLKTMLKSTQNRVISMSMVHEMLYMRNDINQIEYCSYVKELSEYLIKSIKGIDNNIHLKIDIPKIKLGIDTAIPLGLLINEVITNALKYGIVDDGSGEISISLKAEPDGMITLLIGDNGKGFPDTINYKNSKSLGLKLIYNLTRQLKGTIKMDNTHNGTNYIIRFQEIKNELFNVS